MTDVSKFITIEGIDGSGKSTFIPKIQKMFEERGEEVILTREPGGTPYAEVLREHILNTPMDKKTELLLAFAARNEHIVDLIRPSLDAGKVVISDRFTDSTFAYQGHAKGVPLDYIEFLEGMVQQEIKPALTLIFTVPVEVSKQRLSKTGKTPDKFESQNEEFFLKAIEGYDARAKADPERCKIIDSSQGLEYTEQQVLKIMAEYFAKLDLKKSKQTSLKM